MPKPNVTPEALSLSLALDALTVEELKKRASLLQAGGLPIRKADLISFLRRHLDKDGLTAIWSRLSALERAAVAETVHSEHPSFQPERFRARHGSLPLIAERWDQKLSLIHLIFYRGVVPAELRAPLRALAPKPTAPQLPSLDELPETDDPSDEPLEIHERALASGEELLAVLRLVDAGRVSVGEKTHKPSATSMKALSGVLVGGDFYGDVPPAPYKWEQIGPIRAFAWPMLLQGAGLAVASGDRLQLTDAGRKALGAAPEKTLRRSWERWQKSALLDEFSRIDLIKGQSGKGKSALTAPSGRRAVLAEALAKCPVDRWVSVDALFRYMRANGHDFEVARGHGIWHLYIAEQQYGSLGYEGYGGWDILQARYALCWLLEYAATVGFIDVALVHPEGARGDYGHMWGTDELIFLSRYDGLRYLRLTALGAYGLGLSAEYTPAAPARKRVFAVLSNRSVVPITPLAPSDRLALERCAEPTSASAWRLDEGRILAALEAGHTLESIRSFLLARSADAFPDAVAEFFRELESRAQALKPRGLAWLVECVDPGIAQQLADHPRLRALCLRAGDRHLVVPAANEPRFRAALREIGYALPAGGTGES